MSEVMSQGRRDTADDRSARGLGGLGLTVGHSDDVETDAVVEELLEQTSAAAEGGGAKAALLFASLELDHQRLLDRISEVFPGVALIGCTTAGELSSRLGFQEDSTVLAVLTSEALSFGAGFGRGLGADPTRATGEAAEMALEGLGGPPRLCVTTPESLASRGNAVIAGLQAVLGEDVPVVGGTAGDNWRFRGTRQFCGREVSPDAVPVLVIAGPLIYSVGVSSGWTPLGRPTRVSRVEGNVLYELDGLRALDYYQHYLGEHLTPSAEYPLAVLEGGFEPAYLRAPLAYDPEEGSVSFASELPEGALVRMSEATREEIIAASRESVEEAIRGFPEGAPEAALIFSCAGRKHILGTRTEEEAKILRELLPPTVPFCGFYSYGEIGPNRRTGVSCFHNETFITLLLGTEGAGRP